MKLAALTAAAVLCSAATASATIAITDSPSAMFGMVVGFGNGGTTIGFSAKYLTSNQPDTVVGAAGVTYYPWADNHWGFDIGIGYSSGDFGGTLTWDVLQMTPQIGLGKLGTPYPAPF